MNIPITSIFKKKSNCYYIQLINFSVKYVNSWKYYDIYYDSLRIRHNHIFRLVSKTIIVEATNRYGRLRCVRFKNFLRFRVFCLIITLRIIEQILLVISWVLRFLVSLERVTSAEIYSFRREWSHVLALYHFYQY